jgi:hypothetical protein
MVDQNQNTSPTCPFCGKATEVGCLMGKDSLIPFQWYEGEPTFWKNLYPHGDPIGDMDFTAGSYLKGIRCQSCRRIILEY